MPEKMPIICCWRYLWTDDYVQAPFCMMGCSDDWEQYGGCCKDCDYDIKLIAILPGDTYTYTWEGRIYKTEAETCGCQCYYSEDPVVGDYRFSVDVFTEVSCSMAVCDGPAETGSTYLYLPQKAPERFSTAATIPHTGGALNILIDSGDDTDTGVDTGTDSETADDADSETGNGDTDSETGTDTDTAVQQDPITVKVINQSLSTVYLNGISPIQGERLVNGEWVAAAIKAPPCTMSCDSVTTDAEICCIECEMATMTYAILPGDTATFNWDGLIYQSETVTCDCGCYYSELPLAGDYRFSVAASENTQCNQNPCTAPTESGMLYDRLANGDSRQFFDIATVPYTGDSLEIVITRDVRCDDATTPVCDRVVPTCDSASEILAYRNNCYQCVDAETCAP